MKYAKGLIAVNLIIAALLFNLSEGVAQTKNTADLQDGAAILQTLDRSNPALNRIYQEIENRLPEGAKTGSPDSPLLNNLPDEYRSIAAKDNKYIFIRKPDGTIGVADKSRISRGLTATVKHLARSPDFPALYRQNYDRIKAEFDKRKAEYLQKNKGGLISAMVGGFSLPSPDAPPAAIIATIDVIWGAAGYSAVMDKIKKRSDEIKQEELARIARGDPQPQPQPVETAEKDNKPADDTKAAQARGQQRQLAQARERQRREAQARERQRRLAEARERQRREQQARERQRRLAEARERQRREQQARERQRQLAEARQRQRREQQARQRRQQASQATRVVATCTAAQAQINSALQQFYQGRNGRARQMLESARRNLSKTPPGSCDSLNDRINNGLRTLARASAIARVANDAVGRCDLQLIAAVRARYAASKYRARDRVIRKLDAAQKKCNRARRARATRDHLDDRHRHRASSSNRRQEIARRRWQDRRRRPQYTDPDAAAIFGGFIREMDRIQRRQRNRNTRTYRRPRQNSTVRTQRQPARRAIPRRKCRNGSYSLGSCRGGLGVMRSGGVVRDRERLRRFRDSSRIRRRR